MGAPPQPLLAALPATRYFIIKATQHTALDVSMDTGLWQFGNQTEKKVNRSVKNGSETLLVFSVQGSGHFQGYARFTGIVSNHHVAELQEQSQNSGSGSQYYVQWVKRIDLPFQATKHLVNAYNEDNKVQVSKDGQVSWIPDCG